LHSLQSEHPNSCSIILCRKKNKKNKSYETDVDIRNKKKQKKLRNGYRHPQYNFLKWMSTSVIKKTKKKLRNECRHP